MTSLDRTFLFAEADDLDITVSEFEEDDVHFTLPKLSEAFSSPQCFEICPINGSRPLVPTNGNLTNCISVFGRSNLPDVSTYINPLANQHIPISHDHLLPESRILEMSSSYTNSCNSPTPSDSSSELNIFGMGEAEIKQHLASLPAFFQKVFDLESEVGTLHAKCGT